MRKNFAPASGKTTVPMSRPSTTTPPARAEAALEAEQRGAHLGQRRDARGAVGHLGRADCRRHVGAVGEHVVDAAVEVELEVEPVGERGDAAARRPRRPPLARASSAIDAVDRAGVEQVVAEPRRQQARRRRLSGPRRPVDRDDSRSACARPDVAASRSCGSATGTRRGTASRGAATSRG